MSSQPIDKKLLKSLEPLSNLSPDKLDELAQKSRLEKLPAERILFRQGDRHNRLLYVLSGQVELRTSGQKKKQLIKAKTDQARYPIAEQLPRPCTARTKSEVTLLSLDQNLLEILMGDVQQDAIEVTDLSGEHDAGWMLRFLQSPAFLHLPTENIQTLLMKLEEIPFKKGDVIVKQGDESDFYYIVQEGRCSVSRRPAPNIEEIKLAILGVGDGFGEEALITGGKRNATITMLEDGSLMRMKKSDFLELLIKPLINGYNEQQVIKNLAQGSLVIDVRNHDAFEKNHIEGSINIPLSMLRVKIPGLNPERDYILVCEDGTQSEAAAFLLIQHGLNCHVLTGGLNSTNISVASTTAVSETQVETHITRQADENQNIAKAKAHRLKQETEQAKKEAHELANRARAAEQAKASAELELKRVKDKVLAQKNSALQSAQQQIQRETERAKKAELEFQKLLDEQNKNADRQSALNKSLQQAEKMAQESARVAAEAHKQAEREAQEIRQQAEKEAQRLRAEMEAERRQHEQLIAQSRKQEQRQQQAIEEARQKAREVVKHTADEAKAEADSIRQQAVQEAEALREEIEHTRSELERSITDAEQKGELQRKMLLEEAQREAEQVALKTTREAELAAEQIRLNALQEVERLREEMETAKQLVEQEAERVRLQQQQQQQHEQEQQAKQKIEQAERVLQQKLEEEEQVHQKLLAEQARLQEELEIKQKAEQAERARQQEQQAKQKAEQAEHARQQEQQAKQKAEQAERAQQQKLEEEQVERKKQETARKNAEAIKAKLEAAAREKQKQQETQIPAGGLSVGSFTIKESKDRILLESDDDSFIFKLPRITTINKEKLLHEANQAHNQPKEELPSFEVDSDEPMLAKSEPQFIGTTALDAILDEATTSHKSKNKNYFAMAAALLLAVGLGGFAYLKMDNLQLPGQTAMQPASNKTTARILQQGKAPGRDLATAEQKAKQEAESEFEDLLNKWKKSIRNENEQ
jgi:CRP-like cAMP-binding protein/rhodanese-related sulfurtransferase